MEYQKIINLLDDTTNQLSKFRTINGGEINDESKGKYDNSNNRFKTFVIRSTAWKVSKYVPEKISYLDTFHAVANLCNYRDV